MTSPCDLDYQNRTYENLSHEFKELFITAVRAFQLIPMMYNRLTLIDGISHSEARVKIYQDHKDLPGFSRRNIYRYLPSDNPNIPRRVVPSRHKSSIIKYDTHSSQNTLITDSSHLEETPCENDSLIHEQLKQKNLELEKALEESSGPIVAANYMPDIKKYCIPKERHAELLKAIKECKEFVYLEFNNRNMFISAIADTADFSMSEN